MSTDTSFADLGVPHSLAKVLTGLGITTPTPIQAATLPDALAGRDVLGRGRTGSGKTYAFLLPLVARLAPAADRTRPLDAPVARGRSSSLRPVSWSPRSTRPSRRSPPRTVSPASPSSAA